VGSSLAGTRDQRRKASAWTSERHPEHLDDVLSPTEDIVSHALAQDLADEVAIRGGADMPRCWNHVLGVGDASRAGFLHRDDGPALIAPGREEWWLHGEHVESAARAKCKPRRERLAAASSDGARQNAVRG
jgi:hypothetical protein